MSILLDAITREKHDSDTIIEAISVPTMPYLRQYGQGSRNRPLVLLGGIILVLLLVIILLSLNINSARLEPIASQTVLPQANSALESSEQAETPPDLAMGLGAIKMAGKVALPIAVAMPTGYMDNAQLHPTQVNAKVQHSYFEQTLQGSASGANPTNNLSVSDSHNNSDYYGHSDISEAVDINDEPIILGVNANQRGNEILASLQYRVEQATNDVGIDQSIMDSQTRRSDASVMAAFDAALQEVELENAIATPVTRPELDPIPQIQPDSLPKYGQLPIGLQLQVPEFNIQAHVYSTVANNRWLNVDGAELQEGDVIEGMLKIVEIRPRDVVLAIDGVSFKVPAI